MKKRLVAFVLILIMFVAFAAQASANNSKIVALTFDDGPSWKYTPPLLDALAERNVRATFFLVGYCLSVNMDIAERAFNEGHQLANHSYSHSWLTKLSSNGVKSEIEKTNELLSQITGETKFMVRVPYGAMNASVKSSVGASIIQWSVDPGNGNMSTKESTMVSNLVKSVKNGSIIILHDTDQKNINVALAAIDKLLEEGYEFVTLNELFRLRGVRPEDGIVYYSAPPSAAETSFDESRLEEHWAYRSIQTVVNRGIIIGDNEGFKPNGYLSRAMASVILMRLAEHTNKLNMPMSEGEYANIFDEADNFNDVPAEQWYSEAVAWAHANSYIKGVGGGSFDPHNNITKEQFYTILARFAEKEFGAARKSGEPVSYRDDVRISSYAREAVSLIRMTGFSSLNDPEIFRPGDNITRAETAELIAYTLGILGERQLSPTE